MANEVVDPEQAMNKEVRRMIFDLQYALEEGTTFKAERLAGRIETTIRDYNLKYRPTHR